MPEITRDGTQCWRCGLRLSAFNALFTELVNVYNCTLCSECRNDWNVYLHDHADYRHSIAIYDEMRAIEQLVMHDGKLRSEQIAQLREELFVVSERLFYVAQSWVAVTIERKQDG